VWHFNLFDSAYYLGIARHGYPVRLPHPWNGSPIAARAAFFPGLPILIRAIGFVIGGTGVTAGLIAMIVGGLGSALGVWAVGRRLGGAWVADRSVLLYCAFPGAMSLGMVYSEPLMIAFGAAGVLALLNRRWLIAGLCGAAASLTGSLMLAFTAAAAVAALQAVIRRREWRALAAPVLSPLGFLAFMAYEDRRYHSLTAWFGIERAGWHNHTDWGLSTMRVVLWMAPKTEKHLVYNALLIGMFWFAVIGLAVMIWTRLPAFVTVFAFAVCYIAASSADDQTKARLVWVAFPLFTGLAAKLPRWLYWPVLTCSAGILGYLTFWWHYHMAVPV
jgi:hypothetical protein